MVGVVERARFFDADANPMGAIERLQLNGNPAREDCFRERGIVAETERDE
jgi:hypothetical protein